MCEFKAHGLRSMGLLFLIDEKEVQTHPPQWDGLKGNNENQEWPPLFSEGDEGGARVTKGGGQVTKSPSFRHSRVGGNPEASA